MGQNYENEKIKYSNENCSFAKLYVPLIFNQIFHFLDKESRKCLSLCNKKIYQLYSDQVKELKIKRGTEISIVLALIDKYKTANILNLSQCKNIKDFTPISKIERLEILDVGETNICDISFLENNKNIKELHLNSYENIKDFTPISKIERLDF